VGIFSPSEGEPDIQSSRDRDAYRQRVFNETIAEHLHRTGVEFTLSVPFERFTEFKGMIEGREHWHQLNGELSFFETHWKPKSWTVPYRFIFIRKQVRCQDKAPVQLDLFTPTEYGYEFKVIVTNKCARARAVVAFHEGRGSQEGVFSELKSHCQMDYIPVTTRVGNQLYRFAGILAHNLTRELQIQVAPRARATTAKRAALWCFREIETLRRTLIQRAGRIIRPAGKLILSMNSNEKLENELLHFLGRLKALGA
jgi:Transposase DDE domain group 1